MANDATIDMTHDDSSDALEQVLTQYFGYTQFRKGQREIIESLLSRRDVLAIMPTGAGKSLCYQIPALLQDGITLVVSPLISLMHDQVSALRSADVKAAFLNSSLSFQDYKETVAETIRGEHKILYVAPERLSTEAVWTIAHNVNIAMLIIDEAHCVSQWGHDFRPSYLQIREFIDALPNKPVVGAFTATATESVRHDIKASLKLENPHTLITGFDRENLYFEVQRLSGSLEKMRALMSYIRANEAKSGIVYCATRKTVESVCDTLCENGILCAKYHAGMSDAERTENQNDFIYDAKPIIAATSAFGMGIDKSNVSFVIHFNMPKNIESYYQEAGRAGRDGEGADCIVYYSAQDVHTAKFLIEQGENKQHNLDLLKYMTFYCTTSDCLRGYVLKYFGENAPSYCAHCSNCLTHFETIDITTEAQKIISCVYRIEQRGNENGTATHFGKTMIVDILHGSKNQKVLDAGFDTLSTYAIMNDIPATRIRKILDHLLDSGFLAIDGSEFPVVTRSEKSAQVIQRGTDFKLEIKLPKIEEQNAARKNIHTKEDANIDTDLLARLKSVRSRLAAAAQVPAYIVFADSALRDMCIKKPQTAAAFLNVSGVGAKKQEQYGEIFTQTIREYLGTA
ncbi:MAG: DNA helicase RecQ [Treponemataceae bacterium]|nr:MAG: DNA helicase RecQ [Treponemataceae bacterium]